METVTVVTGALTLFGMIVTAGLRIAQQVLRREIDVIEAADSDRKADLAARAIEKIKIPTNDIPAASRVELLREQMKSRDRRFFASMFVTLILGLATVLAATYVGAGGEMTPAALPGAIDDHRPPPGAPGVAPPATESPQTKTVPSQSGPTRLVDSNQRLTIRHPEDLPKGDWIEVDRLSLLGGEMDASRYRFIAANQIEMKNGSSIRGAAVVVLADRIDGGLIDASGQDGAGQDGWSGANGGVVLIGAAAAEGLSVRATGGAGRDGLRGADGQDGRPGTSGRDGNCNGFGQWQPATNGARGEDGAIGQDGGAGGAGGHGGSIVLLGPISVAAQVSGGAGGSGGSPGAGGRGGPGGNGGAGCLGARWCAGSTSARAEWCRRSARATREKWALRI